MCSWCVFRNRVGKHRLNIYIYAFSRRFYPKLYVQAIKKCCQYVMLYVLTYSYLSGKALCSNSYLQTVTLIKKICI